MTYKKYYLKKIIKTNNVQKSLFKVMADIVFKFINYSNDLLKIFWNVVVYDFTFQQLNNFFMAFVKHNENSNSVQC